MMTPTSARDTRGLTREQELALATRWQKHGDRSAAEALVRAHLELVATVARKYRRYAIRQDELVSEGNLGVVRALQKFDPERGLRFATYAVYWIRSCILDHIIKSWSLVGGGSGPLRSKVFFKLRRESIRAANFLGEGEAANSFVAERLGITTTRLASMTQRLDARDVSLDIPMAGDSVNLVERLPAPDNQELELSRAQVEPSVLVAVRAAVSGLDPRERYIAEHRFLADSADEMSLAEVGRRLGISRERARQIEARTKRKLRMRIPLCGSSLFNEWLGHFACPARQPARKEHSRRVRTRSLRLGSEAIEQAKGVSS
jgi:RNA polymerase sigma-32 factor